MPFTFNPGQQGQAQPSAPPSAPPTAQPSARPISQQQQVVSEAPPLIVPTVPTISISAAPVEVISPFAYKNRNKSKFSVYFQFAVFAIFGVISLVTAGLFAWQITLKSQIATAKSELAAKQAGFPKLDLKEMQRLSDRIKLVNRVMNEHASVNTAFKILEASIENPVTYTKFSLTKNRTKSGYGLSFAGETNSYAALYQQTEALNSKTFSKVFSKLLINGLGPLDKKGVGTFKVDTTISIEGINPDTFSLQQKNEENKNISSQNTGQAVTTGVPMATTTETVITTP